MPIDFVAAGAANHQMMFATEARAAGGTAEERYGGVFTYGDGQDAYVAFPCVPGEAESLFADEVLRTVRKCRDVSQVGWWLLDESRVASLGPKLLARGFSWGWRPNWMVLDVERLIENQSVPADVEISPAPKGFSAIRHGVTVGSIAGHVSEFDGVRIGGIYATGVDEQHRRQGIGTALTVAASHRLREQGCRYVLLNATPMGEPIYLRAGFELIGESGRTWWLPGSRVIAPAPGDAEIAFVEAIGCGELDAAEAVLPGALDAPLVCEETALAVAATTGQEAAARWLIEHGATFEVITCWRLGWHDEVSDELRRRPQLANRRTGPMGPTPLQQAVLDDDRELAAVILAADPDLSIVDPIHNSTALGWARYLGRTEIEQLICAAMS